MCEFCENIAFTDADFVQARIKGGDFIYKYKDGYGILIDTGDSGCLGSLQKVRFCPMCSRELSEVTEMTNKDIEHAKEAIDRITEELKHSKDYITQLKHDLDKTYNQLMEVEKEAQDKIEELESELEVKENLLKIKNGLLGNNDDLPDDPIEVAQMLINSTYEYELSDLEKALFKCGDTRITERYSIDDLEQIAEHLLVYCKYNREDEKQ